MPPPPALPPATLAEPVRVYDAAAADEYFRRHQLKVARRVVQTGAYIARFAGALTVSYVDTGASGRGRLAARAPCRLAMLG